MTALIQGFPFSSNPIQTMTSKAEKLNEILAERDHIIREQWIKVMEFRIVQEQLSKCQKTEGVNHYENCKDWADRYLALLEQSKIKGYRKIDV